MSTSNMDLTTEQEKIAYPQKPFRTAEEINDRRRKLLDLFNNESEPWWKRWLAYDAAMNLTWVMTDPQAMWTTFGGSVSDPLHSLEIRNVSPCIGTPDFCNTVCDHQWREYGNGTDLICGRCMRVREKEAVTGQVNQ